jgi:hypothetical protein
MFLSKYGLTKKNYMLHMGQYLYKKNCILIYKKREKKFSVVLENTFVDFPLYLFFGIYIKFVKFLKNLVNISITLKI